MRAVIQRVTSASVAIDGIVTAQISRGLLVLLGIQSGDTSADVDWLALKIANLRVFEDSAGKMNLSLLDAARAFFNETSSSPPGLLIVSQFTLLASTRKGARPSFNAAAPPAEAIPLYETFIRQSEILLGHPVATGTFGAMMQVSLGNNGPVTLMLDSRLRE